METNREPSFPPPRELELNENPVIMLGGREVRVNSITVSEGETGEIEEMLINFGDDTMELHVFKHHKWEDKLCMGYGNQFYPKNKGECALDIVKILGTLKNEEEAFQILKHFIL